MLSIRSTRNYYVLLRCRKVASILNWLIPTWPVVASSRNTMFPLLQQDWEANYCTYSYPLRVRIGVECMAACDDLCGKMHLLKLPLLAVHSLKDTMTDPEGSKQLCARAQVRQEADKHLWRLINSCVCRAALLENIY